MSEEEKEAVEHLNSFLNITEYVWIKEKERLMVNIKIALNLIENQQKELNNLKEIEQSHKEENGKLRVELEEEKENNKALHNFIMFTGGKDIKDFSATEYMIIRQEGYIDGRYYEQQKAVETIMNNYISKDKIKEIYNILGEYRHFSTPTNEQIEQNENAVDKAVNFIKELLEESE